MHFSDELKHYLESVSFALLCVTLEMGEGKEVLVIVKSTNDLIGKLKGAASRVRLGWLAEPTERGPVVCMCIKSAVKDVGELLGECYIDPLNLDDIEQLQQLCEQTQVKVAFFDEEMDITWVTSPSWSVVDRLYAEQALDQGRSLGDLVDEPDFEAAVELFKEQVSLERLAASFLLEEAVELQ